MKILALDIETSPAELVGWGLFDQTFALNQIKDPTRVLCFAAKWLDNKKVHFYSEYHHGKEAMVQAAHALLDEADVVLHYNGTSFDIPHLNREFLLQGLLPPSPYKQIDLFRAVRARFKFLSNKLDWVSQQVGIGSKVKHAGMPLWLKCLEGDEAAWRKMRQYNRQDVLLLEDLYAVLKPWIPNHPSHGAIDGTRVCPACAGRNLQRRGDQVTKVARFARFQCQDCGKWSRETKRIDGTAIVEVPL